MTSRSLDPRALAAGAALAVAYVVAAILGFKAASAAEQVTTVWAPTGLAQAALILWGRRLWPAVWAAAFAVNASTSAPLWTAAPIATGNTLEAFAAATLLSRVRFDPALRRTADALLLILVAAVLAPVISATMGVGTLCIAGVQPWGSFFGLWFAWWLGDAIGALVIAPVILTLARAAQGRGRAAWAETGALTAATLIVTELVFGRWIGRTMGHHPLEFVIFPFLIAAAVRQGQPATALVALSAALVAIWNTLNGFGPFAGEGIHESLVLLQVFMGVVSGTGLLLAAAMTERVISERRRAAAHAVGEILADAPSLPDAATDIVRRICETLNWSHGAVWVVEPTSRHLACLAIWPSTGIFAADTLQRQFRRGEGLPGRVWANGEPTWIDDVVDDGNFPRAMLAKQAGLHGAFAFPVRAGHEVYGVVEFFHRSIVAPDADLLATMASVGNQLGQFVARKQVEAEVAKVHLEREELLQRELTARREAEAANRAKDDFLATLSHELRTPLNAIAGWTRLLLDGALDEQKRQRALEVIARNAQLQSQLVDDILDVSKIITGGLKLNPAPLDLCALVASATETLRPTALAKGIKLESRVPPEARLIEGDGPRLQQVVWNLVVNAIKFTPSGGRIEVELHDCSGDGLRMIVRDDGDGIEPEFLPHVFERFRQGDASTSRQHGGLGLGLAIVRHIVELHGGSVRAESSGRGKGATFLVDIPRTVLVA